MGDVGGGIVFRVDQATEDRLRDHVLPGLPALLESLPDVPPDSVDDPNPYAVAHGFYCRVARTCQAALSLVDGGRGSEAAPLRRTAFEHAVALAWVIREGAPAVAALTRAHQSRMRSIRDLLDDAWAVKPEDFEALLAVDVPTGGQDHLVRFTELIKKYALPESLLAAWLSDTGESHPPYLTARAYWHDGGTRLRTDAEDRPRSDVHAVAFVWWLASCEMDRLTGWGPALAAVGAPAGLPVARLLPDPG